MPDRDRVKDAVAEAEALPVEDRDKGYYASKILYAGGGKKKEDEAKKKKPKSFIEKLREKMGLAELQAEAVEK